jgi:hypothetical protein
MFHNVKLSNIFHSVRIKPLFHFRVTRVPKQTSNYPTRTSFFIGRSNNIVTTTTKICWRTKKKRVSNARFQCIIIKMMFMFTLSYPNTPKLKESKELLSKKYKSSLHGKFHAERFLGSYRRHHIHSKRDEKRKISQQFFPHIFLSNLTKIIFF